MQCTEYISRGRVGKLANLLVWFRTYVRVWRSSVILVATQFMQPCHICVRHLIACGVRPRSLRSGELAAKIALVLLPPIQIHLACSLAPRLAVDGLWLCGLYIYGIKSDRKNAFFSQ